MKQIGFFSAFFLFLLGVMDVFLVPLLFKVELASFEELADQSQDAVYENRMANWDSTHVINPYFGFYGDRSPQPLSTGFDELINVGELGFFCRESSGDCSLKLLEKHDHNTIRFLLVGGSVAAQLYFSQATSMEKKLSKELKRNVEIYSVAFGGFKHPQQLMAIQYLLTLSASFDGVIALDGFNDIVLSEVENRLTGINPTFPRQWRFYVAKNLSKKELIVLSVEHQLNELKESVKAHPILNYSNTLKLLSYFYVNSSIIKTQFKLAQLKSEIKEQKDAIFAQTQSLSNPPTLDFESVGPSLLIEGDNDAVSFILDYYLKSSNQLENLLKSENVLYFHFLQPNLHYQDSRKTTPQEDRDKINQIGFQLVHPPNSHLNRQFH